jgi:hypothetical protein
MTFSDDVAKRCERLNDDRKECITNISIMGGYITSMAGFKTVADEILNLPVVQNVGTLVDNSVAYRKSVPLRSVSHCYLNSIGGMTYKGFTFDCTVTENEVGVGRAPYSFTFPKAFSFPTNDPYAFVPVVVGRTDDALGDASGFYNLSGTSMSGNGYLYGTDYVVGTILKCIPRFQNQETMEYFYPPDCFTDLRDAKPTAVVSYGANLYDESEITFASHLLNGANAYFEKTDEYFKTTMGSYINFYPMQPFGVYLDVGTYTLSLDAFIPTGGAPTTDIVSTVWSYDLRDYSSSSGGALGHRYLSAFDTWERITLTVVITKPSTYYLAIQGRGDATQYRNLDVRYKNIRLTRATDSEYVPYRAPITYDLPTAITNKLGKGCSDTIFDEYSFVDQKAITRVGEGNFNQAYLDKDTFPDVRMCYRHPYFVGMDLTIVSDVAHPIKMPFFDDDKSISAINNDGELFYKVGMYSSNVYIYVPKTVSPDVASFNAWEAQNPLKFVTKLASYTETPITPTGFDGLIEVEAGGYLEFVNDYGYPVPSTVTFQIVK